MKPVATCLALLVVPASLCTGQVTTWQYDNARTGARLNEKILTPQNVNAQLFGKLGAFKADGPVYAQPLFVPNVEISGKGTHELAELQSWGLNDHHRVSLSTTDNTSRIKGRAQPFE